MPTVSIAGINTPNTGGVTIRTAKTRAILRMAESIPFYGNPLLIAIDLPFAPVTVRHEGLAPQFTQLDRPGRAPLNLYANPQLEQLSFEALLVDDLSPGYIECEGKIGWLRMLAALGKNVLFAYGNESGDKQWKITDLSYETILRDPITDRVVQAAASVTLTESIRTSAQIIPGIQRIADSGATVRTGATGTNQQTASTTQNDTYDADAAARRVLGRA